MDANTTTKSIELTGEEIEVSVLSFQEVDIIYTPHEPGRC